MDESEETGSNDKEKKPNELGKNHQVFGNGAISQEGVALAPSLRDIADAIVANDRIDKNPVDPMLSESDLNGNATKRKSNFASEVHSKQMRKFCLPILILLLQTIFFLRRRKFF